MDGYIHAELTDWWRVWESLQIPKWTMPTNAERRREGKENGSETWKKSRENRSPNPHALMWTGAWVSKDVCFSF